MSQALRALIQRQAGEIVPLLIETNERLNTGTDGDPIDVNGATISSITKPDGTALTPDGAFIYVAEGELAYYWNTNGLATGVYKIVFRIGVNGAGDYITKTQYIQLT